MCSIKTPLFPLQLSLPNKRFGFEKRVTGKIRKVVCGLLGLSYTATLEREWPCRHLERKHL